MNRYRHEFWSLLAVFSCLAVYSPAFADQTVRCESENFTYKRCPVETGGEVRLVRQLSDAACRRGDTWGYDRRGIWVDEGCAGEFQVGRRYDDYDRRYPDDDRNRSGRRRYDRHEGDYYYDE
jgi:hypothetical protein